MDKENLETNTFSVTTASSQVPLASTVIKEPELVTIIEDMPLTMEQIEEEQDLLEEAEDELEPNENTPLIRSTETAFDKSGSSFFTHNSKSFTTTFTTSQASLFIPSFQFSLYSSVVSISRSLNQRSVAISMNGESSKSKSTTMTLFERLSEDGQATTILALWNMINMILASSSVLAMPYTIALGGFAALFLILVIGFFDDITSVLLVECLYEISPKSRLRKRVRASYAEIAADVWGPMGGRLVDFITVSLSYCCCVLMVMVMGSSIMELLRSLVVLSLQEWCLLCALAMLPTVFIKRLSILAWLSMLAVLAVFIIIFIVLGFSLGDSNTWALENIPSFNLNTFSVSLGIIMFSYCGHTVFPGIEGSMQEPKKYKKVSHGAFTSVTVMKFLVALFCCLTFGSNTQSIVILNLSSSYGSILSKIATFLVIVNIYFSYPLNMFVVSGTLDIVLLPKFPICYKDKRYNYLWVFVTRTILVFSTLGIAIAVPHFGLLMSIFGSLFGVCITLIFPCLFHLQLKWNKLRWYSKVFEMFIVLFGMAAGTLGLIYSSIALKNAVN
ncbi:hypothetical protein OS493_006635 [Desmophyllum pertusum]|uniref:Amino acid transporter transmembrane domain-containing protein n=1 Tax=Desmophyllum pertusum TaxID=174260 RepID=A0A9W9ZVD6_9CNID|nr:hypothetical protein OS493_006635 [Desmophyllum pertusum]